MGGDEGEEADIGADIPDDMPPVNKFLGHVAEDGVDLVHGPEEIAKAGGGGHIDGSAAEGWGEGAAEGDISGALFDEGSEHRGLRNQVPPPA